MLKLPKAIRSDIEVIHWISPFSEQIFVWILCYIGFLKNNSLQYLSKAPGLQWSNIRLIFMYMCKLKIWCSSGYFFQTQEECPPDCTGWLIYKNGHVSIEGSKLYRGTKCLRCIYQNVEVFKGSCIRKCYI